MTPSEIFFAVGVPILISIIIGSFNNKVNKEELAKMPKQIMDECELKFVSKELHNNDMTTLKEDIKEMKEKIDKIYDFIMDKRCP